jgi:hypothetical protein
MSAVAAETALRSVLVIEGAEELAAIENEVRAFAAPLGYDRFVLFSVSAAQDAVLQSIYRVEDEWFGDGESVDAETYIRRCPVTRHILEAHEPFFWTKTVNGAVRNAIISPWSNGQTEGQITKLKLIKRQMYGRGKIDLLQARLIGAI